MARTILGRVICWTMLVSLACVFTMADSSVLLAQGSVKKAMTKRGRRLPSHYAKVVNEEQRAAIYKIQEEYASKIAALESQLKALKAERNEKIKAVLTTKQQQQIEEAKKKRAEPTAAKRAEKAPAEAPPTDPEPQESLP